LRGSLSTQFSLGVQVAHRVAASFVLAEDFGDQVSFRAVGVFVCSVFIGAIDREAESSVHAEFHGEVSWEAIDLGNECRDARLTTACAIGIQRRFW
jgi:hypothetical protein